MLAGPGSHPTFARTHPSIYARRYLLQSGEAMTHNRLEVVLHEPRLNRRLPDPAFGGGRGGGRPDRRPGPVATLLAFLSPGVHTVNRGSRAHCAAQILVARDAGPSRRPMLVGLADRRPLLSDRVTSASPPHRKLPLTDLEALW